MITEFIVCILAGLGAGLGTGFAGMSAAAVISPMLITFLGMESYQRSASHLRVMCWPVPSLRMNTEDIKIWISVMD